MTDYLLLPVGGVTRRLKLKGGQYHNCWQVTEDDRTPFPTSGMGGLYINSEQLDPVQIDPEPAATGVSSFWQRASNYLQSPQLPDVHHRMRTDEAIFADLYTRWQHNSLTLTRGVTGTHLAWNDLVSGTLRSEGDNDLPTFTMGNVAPTRWLPTSFFDAGRHTAAAFPAMQDINSGPGRQAFEDAGMWLPAGAIVTVSVGVCSNTAICWLNSGEIVARGPLRQDVGEFELLRLVYVRFDASGLDIRTARAPANDGLLSRLRQRPFRPTNAEISDWIEEIIRWHGDVQAATGLNFNDPVDAPV